MKEPRTTGPRGARESALPSSPRHTERIRGLREEAEGWQCVCPSGRHEPAHCCLGALSTIHEVRIPPGGRTTTRTWDDAEIFTYLFRGAIAQRDSAGGHGLLRAGEFQVMSTGRGVRHWETNVSRKDWAHLLRISLRRVQGASDLAHEQRRLTSSQRRNRLSVVASLDGREGSLRVHQDVLVLSSDLEPGHHLVHELMPGRRAWLHILDGEVTLGSTTLAGSDGIGVSGEPTVSLTARARTEVLLVDVGPSPRAPHEPALNRERDE